MSRRFAQLRPASLHLSRDDTPDDGMQDSTRVQIRQDDVPQMAHTSGAHKSGEKSSDDDLKFITEEDHDRGRLILRLPRQRGRESRGVSAELSSEFARSTTSSRAVSRESSIKSPASEIRRHNIALSRSEDQQENQGQQPHEPRHRENIVPFEDFPGSADKDSTIGVDVKGKKRLEAVVPQLHREPYFTGTKMKATRNPQDTAGGTRSALKSKQLSAGKTSPTLQVKMKEPQVNNTISSKVEHHQRPKFSGDIPTSNTGERLKAVSPHESRLNGDEHPRDQKILVKKSTVMDRPKDFGQRDVPTRVARSNKEALPQFKDEDESAEGIQNSQAGKVSKVSSSQGAQSFLYEVYSKGGNIPSSFMDRCAFDKNAGFLRLRNEPTNSIVAHVSSKVLVNAEGIRCVGVWFGESSCHNTRTPSRLIPEPTSEEKMMRRKQVYKKWPWWKKQEWSWWGPKWEQRAGALEAKAALDAILKIRRQPTILANITHVVICSSRKNFLKDIRTWKWVDQDRCISTKGTQPETSESLEEGLKEVTSLLNTLIALRQEQPPIRVSFRLVENEDVKKAHGLAYLFKKDAVAVLSKDGRREEISSLGLGKGGY